MQFNRTADGVMHPLPAPSVDTGMGLERISAVLQHVNSNYEIDLFQSLLNAAARPSVVPRAQASLKVVADHIRSCGFLIADGVTPSNEGVAMCCAASSVAPAVMVTSWAPKGSFFYQIVAALVARDGDAPELKRQQAHIERVLKTKSSSPRPWSKGLRIRKQDLAELKGTVIPKAM